MVLRARVQILRKFEIFTFCWRSKLVRTRTQNTKRVRAAETRRFPYSQRLVGGFGILYSPLALIVWSSLVLFPPSLVSIVVLLLLISSNSCAINLWLLCSHITKFDVISTSSIASNLLLYLLWFVWFHPACSWMFADDWLHLECTATTCLSILRGWLVEYKPGWFNPTVYCGKCYSFRDR